MARLQRLILTAGVFSLIGIPAMAGPCTDRIAEIEKNLTMKSEGAGPAATGAVPGTASGDTSSTQTAASTDPASRLPANRPQTSESAAAQVQASAEQTTTGDTQASQNRLPANRPASPETKAAEVQATIPAQQGAGTSAVMDMLREAKALDQAGREADCMQAVSRISSGSPSPAK